jgi:hypothetical protein
MDGLILDAGSGQRGRHGCADPQLLFGGLQGKKARRFPRLA